MGENSHNRVTLYVGNSIKTANSDGPNARMHSLKLGIVTTQVHTFLSKLMHILNRGKVAQKCLLLLQLKNLPTVNYPSLGENSPNLVILGAIVM
jgi:hypothetical protein